MKQSITVGISFLLCCFSTALFSQQTQDSMLSKIDTVLNRPTGEKFILKKEPKFYLNIHAGSSFALGSTFKFYPDDITSIAVQAVNNVPTEKSIRYKAPSKGLGDGFRYGAGLSYIINDFINIGLDVDYFKSTISKVKDSSYNEQGANGSSYFYKERYAISYDASLLTLTPNITFKAISQPGFFIYNKIGAVITIRPNSIQKDRQDITEQKGGQGTSDSTASTQKRYDWGIKNPAFGFMGGIGIQVKLQNKLRAFGEFQFSHVLFNVRSRTLTDFDVNGKNLINTLTVSEKEVNFSKELTTDDLNTNTNVPSRAIVQKFPVTYVGFQVGLTYRF